MFVGHAFLAFGVAALLAERYDSARRVSLPGSNRTVKYALLVGLVAALFAALPDIDVVHALAELVSIPNGAGVADHFWTATTERHRTTTHSLVVAIIASLGFALWAVRRWAGWFVLTGIAVGVTAIDGLIGGAMMLLFGTAGVIVASLSDASGLSAPTIFGASLLGLAVHPFTDLLTGAPPAFLAPFPMSIVDGRIEPFADATLNLLVAFGAELAVIWFGLLIGVSLFDIDPRRHVHYAALVGIVYAPMALVLDQPSVDAATPFVATILPIGVVGIVGWNRPQRFERLLTIVLTALTAITMAWLAFGVSHLLIT